MFYEFIAFIRRYVFYVDFVCGLDLKREKYYSHTAVLKNMVPVLDTYIIVQSRYHNTQTVDETYIFIYC